MGLFIMEHDPTPILAGSLGGFAIARFIVPQLEFYGARRPRIKGGWRSVQVVPTARKMAVVGLF